MDIYGDKKQAMEEIQNGKNIPEWQRQFAGEIALHDKRVAEMGYHVWSPYTESDAERLINDHEAEFMNQQVWDIFEEGGTFSNRKVNEPGSLCTRQEIQRGICDDWQPWGDNKNEVGYRRAGSNPTDRPRMGSATSARTNSASVVGARRNADGSVFTSSSHFDRVDNATKKNVLLTMQHYCSGFFGSNRVRGGTSTPWPANPNMFHIPDTADSMRTAAAQEYENMRTADHVMAEHTRNRASSH